MLCFILNKFYLRPWVLENDLHLILQIIVLSAPNLIEAIVGTLVLTGILLHLKQYFIEKTRSVKDIYFHFLAVLIAAIYVISQEFKFHSLGGNNVYDVYDVIASIIGLSLTFGLIQVFGFVDESEVN